MPLFDLISHQKTLNLTLIFSLLTISLMLVIWTKELKHILLAIIGGYGGSFLAILLLPFSGLDPSKRSAYFFSLIVIVLSALVCSLAKSYSYALSGAFFAFALSIFAIQLLKLPFSYLPLIAFSALGAYCFFKLQLKALFFASSLLTSACLVIGALSLLNQIPINYLLRTNFAELPTSEVIIASIFFLLITIASSIYQIHKSSMAQTASFL